MAEYYTPTQEHFNDACQERVYDYGTADSRKYLSRASNLILNAIGNDCVLKGFDISDLSGVGTEVINLTVGTGVAIQDVTLMSVSSTSSLSIDVTSLDDTGNNGCHLAVFADYVYLDSTEPNPLVIRLYHVTADGMTVTPTFNTIRDRILLGIINFTKDVGSGLITSLSLETGIEVPTLSILGTEYYVKGWKDANLKLTDLLGWLIEVIRDSATGSMIKKVTQSSHGFAVNDIIRYDSSTHLYTKAQANSLTNARAIGIVSEVDGNDFTLTQGGFVSGLSGLTEGINYLSADTAGALTITEPTGQNISKPLFVAVNSTSGYFINWRGLPVDFANLISNLNSLKNTLAFSQGIDLTYANTGSSGISYKDADVSAGTVYPGNMKLSLADNYAFVDFSSNNLLTGYIGKKLTLTDQAGKKAIGYIKSAGTGSNKVEMTYAASGSSGISAVEPNSASGTVSLANMKLSLANGNAFADFNSAGTLTNYIGQKITVKDSAGKTATGFIKAAGGTGINMTRTITSGSKLSLVDGTAFVDIGSGVNYTSDFSSGTDGWVNGRVTLAGNIDSIGGENDCLRFTVTDTTNDTHYATKTTLTVGRRYRVSFRYYIPSGQSNVDGLIYYLGGYSAAQTVLDTWTTVTVDGTADLTVFQINAADGGNRTFQDAGGNDVFYIKDITVTDLDYNLAQYADGKHLLKITDSTII